MALNAFPLRTTVPDGVAHIVTMVGTGASAPTKVYGQGVAITRTGAGDYRLTWAENPGTYVATLATLRAATEGDNKGHTVVVGSWSSSAFTLDVTVWDAADAAEDLEASEWLEMAVIFKTTAI